MHQEIYESFDMEGNTIDNATTGTLASSVATKGYVDNATLYLNTRVHTVAEAVTVVNTDYVIVVNKSVGSATTVNLPAGSINKAFIIKDGKGDSNTNTITIDGNVAETIDGATTRDITTPYGSVSIVWNGTQWNIL